jgi:hypothetical protein
MVFHFYPRGYVEGKEDYLIYMGRCAAVLLLLLLLLLLQLLLLLVQCTHPPALYYCTPFPIPAGANVSSRCLRVANHWYIGHTCTRVLTLVHVT